MPLRPSSRSIGEKSLCFVPAGDFGVFNGTSLVLRTDLQFRLGGKEAGFTPYMAAGGTWWGFDPEGDNGSDLPDFRFTIGRNF